jgi:biotin-(acetyl-CoA carboxylase) ligase
MTAELNLPPLYETVILAETGADARAHANSLAADGGEAGLFVWRPAADRIDCAIVLRPEEARAQIMPVVLVASLALLDAVGSAGPAAVAADLVWPAGLRINSALCGGIALDLGPGDNPGWAVVSAILRKTGEPGAEGGERPDVTALYNEGFADMADSDLVEAFARHFLVWMDRWDEQGLDPIARHWLHCARSNGVDTVLMIGAELIAGSIEDLDDSGGLVLDTAGGRRVLPLEPDLLSRIPVESWLERE